MPWIEEQVAALGDDGGRRREERRTLLLEPTINEGRGISWEVVDHFRLEARRIDAEKHVVARYQVEGQVEVHAC